MWAWKEKGNLPLPVSIFFPCIFQRYSPPPRINNTAATALRMPGSRSALACLAESVFLKHRGKIKSRENLRYPLPKEDRQQVEKSKES